MPLFEQRMLGFANLAPPTIPVVNISSSWYQRFTRQSEFDAPNIVAAKYRVRSFAAIPRENPPLIKFQRNG